MAAQKVVRIAEEDDVFAADETKVHTLSRQAISEMLDTAARQEAISSAPPPPESGVRAQAPTTRRPSPTKSGTMPIVVPGPAALPVLWENDDEDFEPTRLTDRVSMPRQALVTQLMNDPPIIICPPTQAEPLVALRVETAQQESVSFDATPVHRVVDRWPLAITLLTFVVTLLPGLVLLHHLLAR